VSDTGSTTRTGTTTVLFTDLAGSTEERARLGEEVADELTRRHDRILATEISAHHGVVVKTLGDGVLATFGSAANAVAAAVAIQQTVADLNDDLPAPLRVKIGISAGDVAWRGSDPAGTPVIEAARLCAKAGAGEIVIADIVQAMARGRGGHSFVPLGPLPLKGLADPVPASRVRWAGDEYDTAITATAAAAPAAGAGPAPGRRWLVLGVVVGAVLLVALLAVVAALVLADDGGSGNDTEAFCSLAAGAPDFGDALSSEAARTDALATVDELEAAAPDDEIRADVVTIRGAFDGTIDTSEPMAAAQVAAALESLDTYLTDNC
jgi:class 3 adenylate cyclase